MKKGKQEAGRKVSHVQRKRWVAMRKIGKGKQTSEEQGKEDCAPNGV
jgi:hypothetical protein